MLAGGNWNVKEQLLWDGTSNQILYHRKVGQGISWQECPGGSATQRSADSIGEINYVAIEKEFIVLVNKTASVDYMNVENPYTVVRGYGINGQKTKHKNVTLLEEMMDIIVIVKGKRCFITSKW